MALESATIVTPNPVAPEGHDEKMIKMVDERAAKDSERPDWLPEKFKTVEEMAASYKELEAKQSAPKDAPGDTPKDAPKLEVPVADATQAAAKAGLDLPALNAEYAQTGKVSDEAYAKLAEAGFDKATVDGYVAGQQALANQFQAEVLTAVPGGAEKYPEMIEWAKANLTDAEVAAYNKAVSTNDKEAAKLAIAGLGVKFKAAVGNEPNLEGGYPRVGSSDVFASKAEMTKAMGSREYKTDPAFRRAVAEKLNRSNIM